MKIYSAADRASLASLYAGGWEVAPDVAARVAEILADVRTNGDEALVRFTRMFDAPEFDASMLRVKMPTLDEARAVLPAQIVEAVELAKSRVAAFHARQIIEERVHTDADGTKSAFVTRPLAAIGSYVPGGSATLPSSVVMGVVPAKIAGVQRIVVVTPPRKNGAIDPAVMYACVTCGADEVYAVGGAHAVAALAYGTATIAPVDKIVGPGNVWVTEAKRRVFGICGIDGLAGPSEVLVVADTSAKPELVAAELLAQAEHDPLARVAAVSTDMPLLEKVAELLEGPFAAETGRSEIIGKVLGDGTFLIKARDLDEVLDVIERFAPEHLSLQMRNPWAIMPNIRRAGAIFVGDQTPVACGDYLAGSNHTLPTSGAGRFSSGLRTADFQRTMSIIENSRARMEHDAPLLEAIALFEGLPAHARTAKMRAAKESAS